jgi:hypothetical protein
MLEKEPTPGGLVKFHTAHKLTREAGTRVPTSRHGPQPILTPGQAVTPRWAASSQTQASGIGTN